MSSHGLWVERYRPQDLSTYVGNEHLKTKVERFLDDGNIPHLLLYGRAGGGKTTLAKIIVNSIECDYLYINACLLYTSPSPRDYGTSRMPSSA